MIEAKVRIIAVEDTVIHYAPSTPSSCGTCQSPCGRQRLTSKKTMPLGPFQGLRPDDELTLAVAPSQILASCFRVFLIPMVSSMAMILLIDGLLPDTWLSNFNPDLVRCAAGILGLMVSLMIVRRFWRLELGAEPRIIRHP